MVTISCAFRYSVSGRSTGTLISVLAPVWSMPVDALGQPRIVRIRDDQGDGGFLDFHHNWQVSMTFGSSRYKHVGNE